MAVSSALSLPRSRSLALSKEAETSTVAENIADSSCAAPSPTVPLDKIPFVDHPTIRFNETESVEMPFRYVIDKQGEPILPEGMRELLR